MRIIFGVACMVLSSCPMGMQLVAEKRSLNISGYSDITGTLSSKYVTPFGGKDYIKTCTGGWVRIYVTYKGSGIYSEDAHVAGLNMYKFESLPESYLGYPITVSYEFHDVVCDLVKESDFFGVDLSNVERSWSGMSNLTFGDRGNAVWRGGVVSRSTVSVADVLELKIGQCAEIYSNLSGAGVVSMNVPEFITNPKGDRLAVRRDGRFLCLDSPAVKPTGGRYQGMMHVSLRIP